MQLASVQVCPPTPSHCLNFLDLPLHIMLFVFQHFTKLLLNVEFC